MTYNKHKPKVIQKLLFKGDEDSLSGPLDTIIRFLLQIKKEAEDNEYYNISIDIDKEVDYKYGDAYCDVEVEITALRKETKEEVATRVSKEVKTKTIKKETNLKKREQRRKLYLELRKEFDES